MKFSEKSHPSIRKKMITTEQRPIKSSLLHSIVRAHTLQLVTLLRLPSDMISRILADEGEPVTSTPAQYNQ